MNFEQVKRLRIALRLTQPQLAGALGLQPANGDRTVRDWEAGTRNITGPAALALSYLAQGALDDVMKEIIPEFVIADSMMGPDQEFPEMVIRLHRPRFVAVIIPSDAAPPEADLIEISDGAEALTIALWIDKPDAPPGWDVDELLRRAAALFESHAARLNREFDDT